MLVVLEASTGRPSVRKNSGASDVGKRPRLNFIEGANVTLTVTDDPVDDEIDITIAASGMPFDDGANPQPLGTAGTGDDTSPSRRDHVHQMPRLDQIVAPTAAVDFATYKAVALACDNGSTLPSAPTTGQWFLHTPTGRSILMQYTGTAWQPIMSFGAMAVYVDKTEGTDDAEHGTAADASAFKTIQYAVDMIPPLFSGNISIYVNDESYGEAVVVRGKAPTGNYTISVYGTLTALATGIATSKTQGTGATQGSLTRVGAFGSYDEKLVYTATEDAYRVIDSDSADAVTIVGCFTDATNKNYTIYAWGATTTSFSVYGCSLCVYDFATTGTWGLSGAYVTLYRCKTTGAFSFGTGCVLEVYYSFLSHAGADFYCVDVGTGNKAALVSTKMKCANAGRALVRATSGGYFSMRGSILDGASLANTIGLDINVNGSASTYQPAATGYNRIRNLTTGIYAYAGGMCTNTANNQYSGNSSANETAAAASYGYID